MFSSAIFPGDVILTVSEVTSCVRTALLQEAVLQDVWVRGEVASANLSKGGHLFLSLRDSEASIKGVVWSPLSYRLRRQLVDGQEVMAHGRVDVYPPQGVYQLYIDEAVPVGLGLAYLEFERVKRKLEDEGLFATERKRPLPAFPVRIGVVTSAHGAARWDIENVLGQRWPCAELYLAPTSVQGEDAPEEIVAALEAICKAPIEVVILARGGGDKEALWCFNDERVARAISLAPVPVVTGIGHDTDFTIADFVADCRAPTPSAAAAAAVPDARELRSSLTGLRHRLVGATKSAASRSQSDLAHAKRALYQSSPRHSLENGRLSLDEQTARLVTAAERSLARLRHGTRAVAVRLRAASPLLAERRHGVAAAASRAHWSVLSHKQRLRQEVATLHRRCLSLDPAATLARGYAVVHRGSFDGQVVTQASQLEEDDVVAIRLHLGRALAAVTQTLPDIIERVRPR